MRRVRIRLGIELIRGVRITCLLSALRCPALSGSLAATVKAGFGGGHGATRSQHWRRARRVRAIYLP
eukprot:6200716-Pleurochrysis_carterae.AAC.1